MFLASTAHAPHTRRQYNSSSDYVHREYTPGGQFSRGVLAPEAGFGKGPAEPGCGCHGNDQERAPGSVSPHSKPGSSPKAKASAIISSGEWTTATANSRASAENARRHRNRWRGVVTSESTRSKRRRSTKVKRSRVCWHRAFANKSREEHDRGGGFREPDDARPVVCSSGSMVTRTSFRGKGSWSGTSGGARFVCTVFPTRQPETKSSSSACATKASQCRRGQAATSWTERTKWPRCCRRVLSRWNRCGIVAQSAHAKETPSDGTAPLDRIGTAPSSAWFATDWSGKC